VDAAQGGCSDEAYDMKDKAIALSAMLLAIVAASCQAGITEDQIFRIESLYEHTVLMRDMSDPFVLQMVRLDASAIVEGKATGPEEKMVQLESSMGVAPKGGYEERITALEIRMNDMMKEWARYNTNQRE
jgi:hypothetical protein